MSEHKPDEQWFRFASHLPNDWWIGPMTNQSGVHVRSSKEDADRLVQCWNFCADIPSTLLAIPLRATLAAKDEEIVCYRNESQKWQELAHRKQGREMCEYVESLNAEIAAMKVRCQEAEDWLAQHGHHAYRDCVTGECGCGLDKILAKGRL